MLSILCYNASGMSELKLKDPRRQLEEFCKKHHVRKLAFFGWVLREDFSPSSDSDVFVEFEPGKTPGVSFFRTRDKLSRLLGIKADLDTPGFISKQFREQVIREAEVQYVKA